MAVTADGSYKISPVAVEFYKGEEGDEVVVVIPVEERNAPFAAVESVKKEEVKEKPSKPSVVSAVKKVVKKTVVAKKTTPTKKKVATKKKAVAIKPTSPKPVEKNLLVPEPEVENDEELR